MSKFYLRIRKLLITACLAIVLYPSVSAVNLIVSGISNPSAANGTYVPNTSPATVNGKDVWVHSSGGYYIYNDIYQSGNPDEPYWNIDVDLLDQNPTNDVLFFSNDNSSAVSPTSVSSWSPGFNPIGPSGSPVINTVFAPEIDIQGNVLTITDGTISVSFNNHTHFGSADVSIGTATRTYTIKNNGSAALTLSGLSPYVTISGTNPADFSVTVIPSNSIAAGGTTTFQITFNPSAEGNRYATISIGNNDGDEHPYTFDIQGWGFTPKDLIVSGITNPVAANGNYIYQGVQSNFQYWKHQTLGYYLFNDEFSSTQYWNIDVDTDDSDTDYLFFKQSEAGTPVGLVSWTANTAGGPTGSPVITEGIPVPDINLVGNSVLIPDDDATPSLNDYTKFGYVDYSSGTNTRTYTIQNTGGATLTLSGSSPFVTISGANAADFSVTTPPSSTIAGGNSTTFVVTFNPSFIGTHSATLSIASDDTDENPYNFTIQGEGFTPKSLVVSGITSPVAANGNYIFQGVMFDCQYWKHQTLDYYIFNDEHSGARYWNMDVDTDDSDADFLFYKVSENAAPVGLTGWTANSGITGSPIIVYSGPEINIQGNSNTIADGDVTPTATDHTDFGSQSVCSGTIVRTFTIQNTGLEVLNITSIAISGAHSGDFAVTFSPASSVAASGSTTFQVTFNPSVSGTRSVTITVNSDDSDESAYDFTIQGTGTDPEVNVLGNGNSIADGDVTASSTDHTDFGSQSICNGAIVRTFTIQNAGNSNLSLSNPSISGANAGDFTVTTNPSTPVAASGSTTFQVSFDPSVTGTRSATVSFTNDDCDEATYDFAIQGTGTEPEVNVLGNGNSISDGDATPSSTDHTDFGSQSVCSGTVVRAFTIQNTGTSNLNLANPTLSGANASDFSVTANPSTPVAVSGSTTFQVTFNPSAIGSRSAIISFTNDDCDEATYDFAIQGTGIDPEVNVQGNSTFIVDGDMTPSLADHTDFGSQSVCSGTIVRMFTIQNAGTSNLSLSNPGISGANASDFTVTTNPSTPVVASGSTTFQVSFDPSATGIRSATISFTNDDCDEATYDFAIQGTGIDPEVNVLGNGNSIADGDATPSLTDHTDFGSQLVTSGSIVTTFTIQNTGTSNLNLANPILSGANAIDFSVTANPVTPVAASGSTTFQVSFDPSATGIRSATVSFTNDDCDEATYDFAIQGTGITVPTLTSSAATSVGITSATLGGNITADGGASITERGVVYSTTDNTPTIAEGATKVTIGSGIGVFSQSVGSLITGTTYYFNAYATNLAGTGYGNELSFKTKTQLTIGNPVIASKSYNGNTDATVSSLGTLSGVDGTDDVSVTPTAVFDSKDAGTGKTVTVSYVLNGLDKDKYIAPVNSVVNNGEVTKATLTVTAGAKTKVYGAVNPSLTFTYTGWQNSEGESVLTTKPTASATVTVTSPVAVYTDDITVSGGVDENYDFTYVAANLEVTKATLTVTADAKTKVYGAANPTLTFVYSGWQNGETESVLTTKPTASTTVDLMTNVGIHTNVITVSGGVDENYAFTYVAANLEVTKAMLTVTADAQTKTYGAANPTLTFVYSGWQNSDDADDLTTKPTASTTVTVTSPVAVYPNAITILGGVDENYDFTYVAANLEVIKTMLTVTAGAKTKVYGAVNPPLTFTYIGWQNGEGESVLTTKPTASVTVTVTSPVAVYTNDITVSGGADENYDFTYVAANLEVTKATLTVTAAAKTKVYGAANPILTFNYSGWQNGDDADDLTTKPTASTTVTLISPVAVYSNAVTVSGGVDENYAFTYVAANLEVTKAMLTVTADAQTKTYGAANPTLTLGYSGWQNSDDADDLTTKPTASTTVTITSPVAVYPNAITILGGVDENYDFTYVAANLEVTKATLTVTADSKTKCNDGKIYSGGYGVTFSGFMNGEDQTVLGGTLTFSGTAMAATQNGIYTIIPSGLTSVNYELVFQNGTLGINQLPSASFSGPTSVCIGSAETYLADTPKVGHSWSVSTGGTYTSTSDAGGIIVRWNTLGKQTISITYFNASGCSVTSAQSVTVNPLPTATISGDAIVCAGSGTKINVALTGSAPWSFTYTDGTSTKTVTGIKESPYAFTVTQPANTTNTYTITNVSDNNGCSATGAGKAVITVRPGLETIISSNFSTVCSGSGGVQLTATNPGGTVETQWQSSYDNVSWTDIANAKSLNYSPGIMSKTTYFRMVSSITDCGNQTSNVIKISVPDPITAPVISAAQTICPGSAPTELTSAPAMGGSGMFIYQWQKKTGDNWVNVNSDKLKYQPEALTATTWFRLIATDKETNSCGPVYSNEIVITVKSITLPGTLSADQLIAPGAKPASITSVTAGSGDGTITYAWESSVDKGLNWVILPNENNNAYTPGIPDQPVWYRRITISTENSVICTAATDPVKINLWPTGIDNPENGLGIWSAYAVRNTEIRLKGEVSKMAVATLYDIQGRVIVVKNLDKGSMNIIPAPYIKTGVYLLFVKDNERMQKFKIPVRE